MSFYGDHVLPRLTNVLLGNSEFSKIRGRVAAGLEGDVLEVGFGSGLNVPHYPSEVRHVHALDPAVVGRKLAAKRLAASAVAVEFVEIEGDAIPLPSESVDHVLITWTMCTIPDIERALAEMRRVLRGGGTMRFVEHGRSPDAEVARWQDRLTPLQRRWAGGCHLNRPIAQLVACAGFEMARLDNYYMKGPKALGYMFEGVATRS
jgi:ubiquinone/menaquinone biosynthesis C-methylase UbiE